MAPERLSGGRATFTADLFALGATLYYAAEGTAAFERDTVLASIAAVLNVDPVPIHSAPSLWPAIGGLLVKDPARRLRADGAKALLARALVSEEDDRQPLRAPSREAPPHGTAPPGTAPRGSATGRWDASEQDRAGDGPADPPTPGHPAPVAAPERTEPSGRLTGGRLSGRPRLPHLRYPRGVVVLAAAVAALFLAASFVALAWTLGGRSSGSDRASGPGRIPPAMVGTWAGNVTQGLATNEVKLTIRGGDIGAVIGFGTYPSVGCATDLTLIDVDGPAVTVQETLTKTTGLCWGIDRLRLTLGADGGTLGVYFAASLLNAEGRGVLTRS
jgi:hypothetical protein